MNLTRKNLRRLILEEYEKMSELNEFAGSKSGQRFKKEGHKIKNAGSKIREIADDQTGKMRKTLYDISEFVEKLGESLSSIDDLSEGGSKTDSLPTVSELKKLIKAIKSLES